MKSMTGSNGIGSQRLRSTRTIPEDEVDIDLSILEGCPHVYATIQEMCRFTQAPGGLVMAGFLGALSVAAQGGVDTERVDGKPIPISLMVLALAGSGERKSEVEHLCFGPIRRFQAEKLSGHRRELKSYQLERKAFDYRVHAKSKEVAKVPLTDPAYAQVVAELAQLAELEPRRPPAFKALYEDATMPALLRGIADDYPYPGLISGEGGTILGSGAARSFPEINSLWSGSTIDVARSSAPNISISNARLTMMLLVQEEILDKFLEKKGDESRGAGLWARALLFNPSSTRGRRPTLEGHSTAREYLELFERRVTQMLECSYRRFVSGNGVEVLRLSGEAKVCVREMFDSIESEMLDGGRYETARDHGSKLPEIICRVAALLSYYENGVGEVPLSCVRAAESIVLDCSKAFINYFSPKSSLVVDAELLLGWLASPSSLGKRTRKQVLQFGPRPLRKSSRLTKILNFLVRKECVEVGVIRGGHSIRLIRDSLPEASVDDVR